MPAKRFDIQFRPPSSVSPDPFDLLLTDSKVGKLLQSTREELLVYGQELLGQAAEDHFMECGLDADELPTLLVSPV